MWIVVLGCVSPSSAPASAEQGPESPERPAGSAALADGFDFPVGPPGAAGYRDAQPFGVNRHLGSDWNGVGGANTDYGDPVHAIAAGEVVEASDVGGGWGQVVRIVHATAEGPVESLYAHLSATDVEVGDLVTRGQRIGAIGDAGGVYLAHLHLELRVVAGRPLGGGYGTPDGQVDPTGFIQAHRP
jgi:murein DD-endopeptidase MepM/ murein hydrolase activator NlpD